MFDRIQRGTLDAPLRSAYLGNATIRLYPGPGGPLVVIDLAHSPTAAALQEIVCQYLALVVVRCAQKKRRLSSRNRELFRVNPKHLDANAKRSRPTKTRPMDRPAHPRAASTCQQACNHFGRLHPRTPRARR